MVSHDGSRDGKRVLTLDEMPADDRALLTRSYPDLLSQIDADCTVTLGQDGFGGAFLSESADGSVLDGRVFLLMRDGSTTSDLDGRLVDFAVEYTPDGSRRFYAVVERPQLRSDSLQPRQVIHGERQVPGDEALNHILYGAPFSDPAYHLQPTTVVPKCALAYVLLK